MTFLSRLGKQDSTELLEKIATECLAATVSEQSLQLRSIVQRCFPRIHVNAAYFLRCIQPFIMDAYTKYLHKIFGNHCACAQVSLQCVPDLLPLRRPRDEARRSLPIYFTHAEEIVR